MDNPFEVILAELRALREEFGKFHNQPAAEPRPEWEPLHVAIKTRGKSRKTLKDLVHRGEVRMRSEHVPGGIMFLLLTADLDRLFPPRSKK